MFSDDLRCEVCGRRIYATDFVRGRAKYYPIYDWQGPDERLEHTYDCEKVRRRLVTPAAPGATANEGRGDHETA